jgi:hypothetical protein
MQMNAVLIYLKSLSLYLFGPPEGNIHSEEAVSHTSRVQSRCVDRMAESRKGHPFLMTNNSNNIRFEYLLNTEEQKTKFVSSISWVHKNNNALIEYLSNREQQQHSKRLSLEYRTANNFNNIRI